MEVPASETILTGAFYVGLLDGLLGVAGMKTLLDSGSFPKMSCVTRTSNDMVDFPANHVSSFDGDIRQGLPECSPRVLRYQVVG
jgi:hypothetical protein